MKIFVCYHSSALYILMQQRALLHFFPLPAILGDTKVPPGKYHMNMDGMLHCCMRRQAVP